MSRARNCRLAAAVLLSTVAIAASAQTAYPTRPVRYIVPFTPAGTTDFLSRVLAQKLTEIWGQQVIIENRPGAGSNVGAEIAARSTPDGYTLYMAQIASHGINPTLYRKLNFDPVRDFAPVTRVATLPNLLCVHPAVPARTVQELIAHSKAIGGKLNMGSAGTGTSPHLSGEIFKAMTGAQWTHIPYKGSAPALADLLGGQVQAMFDNIPVPLPHVKSGKLRALGVTSLKRSQQLPDVPTIDETGVKGYDVVSWFALMTPAGVPKAILAKIHADAVKVLGMPDVRERIIQAGVDPSPTTPEELAAFIRAEIAKWGKAVRDSGATAE
jgi:tripartite-type tricarboxylate transporter receptor subunit TctC